MFDECFNDMESEITVDGLIDLATVINSGAQLASKPPEAAYFIAAVQDMIDNQNLSGEYIIKDYTRWFDNVTIVDETVGFLEMTLNRTIAFGKFALNENKIFIEIV